MSEKTRIRHTDGRRGVIVRSYPEGLYVVDFGHYTQLVEARDLERDAR